MIRALIVDDEKLVRKGLLLTMPWRKFGIDIAGEASNGKKALEWLEREPVDMLFTDLMMPEMDGLELMKRVKREYPRTAVVVLTCHQDFHFIQDALRLGAIDYILKTQLENERMEEVLERIVARYGELYARGGATSQDERMLLFVPERPGASLSALEEAFGADALEDAGNGCRLLRQRRGVDERVAKRWIRSPEGGGWLLVKVSSDWSADHAAGETIYDALFYEYVPGKTYYELRLPAAEERPTSPTKPLIDRWSSLSWTEDAQRYREAVAELSRLGPEVRLQLRDVFRSAIREWSVSIVSGERAAEWMAGIERFRFWTQWEEWLADVWRHMSEVRRGSQLPDEIVNAVFRAIDYMRALESLQFTQETVAAASNMSRAYFSQCFKQITGKSFFEFARLLRIAMAKRLLGETDLPVYAIAERAGFRDERYFSRMFQSEVGSLPSEYRADVQRTDTSKRNV